VNPFKVKNSREKLFFAKIRIFNKKEIMHFIRRNFLPFENKTSSKDKDIHLWDNFEFKTVKLQ